MDTNVYSELQMARHNFYFIQDRTLIATCCQYSVYFSKLTLGSSLGLTSQGSILLLLLVESGSLNLSLLLQGLQQFLVLPSNRVGQFTNDSELPDGLEAEDPHGGRYDDALHLVVWLGDSLKGGEASDGVLATGGFLVDHTADGAPYHACRGFEVVWTLARVGVHALPAELGVLDPITND